MARAYETFLLLHGPVNAVLDAPVAVSSGNGAGNGPDNGAGNGAGNGTDNGAEDVAVLPGREVLRRLALARKRLRKAKMEADEVWLFF